LEEAKHELDVAQRHGQYDKASQLRFGTIPELERQLPKDDEMKGDASYAHEKLGWKPKVTFPELVRLMVEA